MLVIIININLLKGRTQRKRGKKNTGGEQKEEVEENKVAGPIC